MGNLRSFENADRLAAYAGLVPAARDSGNGVGNDRRMRGGNKVPKRVYLPVGIRQPSHEAGVQGLLRSQAGRRQEAHPGLDRSGSSPCQRSVGDAARQDDVHGPVCSLTSSQRFHQRQHQSLLVPLVAEKSRVERVPSRFCGTSGFSVLTLVLSVLRLWPLFELPASLLR